MVKYMTAVSWKVAAAGALLLLALALTAGCKGYPLTVTPAEIDVPQGPRRPAVPAPEPEQKRKPIKVNKVKVWLV